MDGPYSLQPFAAKPGLPDILYTALILCVLAFFAKGCYNRYFHPLSDYPGPFWASVTDFYILFTIKSIPTRGLKMHGQYGPIVRIAPNLLSFSDPTLLPRVYHGKADKTPFYSSWLFGNTVGMFQTLDHKAHATKSRIVSPCCSMKALKGFERDIDERILELCDVLRQKSITGEEVDFAEYTRYESLDKDSYLFRIQLWPVTPSYYQVSDLMFSNPKPWFLSDVFGHLTYGEPVGCVAQGQDVDGMINALQDIYGMVATVAVLPWLLIPIIRNILVRNTILPHLAAVKGLNKLTTHYEAMLSKRSTMPRLRDRQCMFDSLLEPAVGVEQKPLLNSEEIKAEVILFTSAALDGLAALISPFMDHVIQRPAVYRKVVAEIQSAEAQGLLSSPIVKYDETTALPYFMACVYETLRFETPAQTILPRYISPGGLDLGSTNIPAQTEMAASPFIIHRDKATFGDDADTFRPERWLESKERSQHMERYGMWWGYGDRRCTGRNLAQLQMQKLCLQLFRDFEIAPANPEKRFTHERWAVGMFWNQSLKFKKRAKVE